MQKQVNFLYDSLDWDHRSQIERLLYGTTGMVLLLAGQM